MSSAVPEGWHWSDLGSYINIGRGYAFKSEDYQDCGVPVVRVTNIEKDGRLNLSDSVVYLSKENAANYSGYELNEDDVLIVMVGATVGKLAKVESAYSGLLLNQNMWRLVVKSENESSQKYAYYAVQPVIDKFLSSQQGSARGFLTQKDFSLAETVLPPLPEQKKIATILSSVDDVIEKTTAQIDKLKDLKTGMMQELLTKGIGHTEFKDSPVGRIPVGWEVCSLGDITEQSAFGPRFSSDYYSDDGNIGCVRTTDMDKSWDINYSTVPLAKLDYAEFESHILEAGDLLVTRSGTCGLVDVFCEQSIPMVAAAFLIRFRLKKSANPWFVRYAMMSPNIQESVQMLASGGVQKNLSGSNLKTLLLPMPSPSEQMKIVELIESLNNKISATVQKKEQLVLVKIALMQDLLTGKVRVSVN